jgi:hypothetical protein
MVKGWIFPIRLRGNAACEALNFVDGRRSIYDITRAVSTEYGPQNVEDIFGLFQASEKVGLVKLIIRK